jgi:hypothetical protein
MLTTPRPRSAKELRSTRERIETLSTDLNSLARQFAKDDALKIQLDTDVYLLQSKCEVLEESVATLKNQHAEAMNNLRTEMLGSRSALTMVPLDVTIGYCNSCGDSLGDNSRVLNLCGAVSWNPLGHGAP